jgi:hypothetical protein
VLFRILLKIAGTMGLLVRKTIYLMQKIQKIYIEEISMYGIICKENHIFEAKNTENIQ